MTPTEEQKSAAREWMHDVDAGLFPKWFKDTIDAVLSPAPVDAEVMEAIESLPTWIGAWPQMHIIIRAVTKNMGEK